MASNSIVKIKFVYDHTKEEVIIDAPCGMSVLEVAKQNNVNIEGACNGGLACSTCHVYIEDKQNFDEMQKAKEDEEDMLDLAFDVRECSRLCCQLIVTEKFDGITFTIPKSTCNVEY